jgi:hypothetical protein
MTKFKKSRALLLPSPSFPPPPPPHIGHISLGYPGQEAADPHDGLESEAVEGGGLQRR